MWDWMWSALGVSKWVLYFIQSGVVISTAAGIYASFYTVRKLHFGTPTSPLDQPPPPPPTGSHLAAWATPSSSAAAAAAQPSPRGLDFAHVMLRLFLLVVSIALVIAVAVVIWYDFRQEHAELYQKAVSKRAEAQENWHRCADTFPPSECDAWRSAKTWTNDTIARNAFHGAWAHIGHHAHEVWEELPLNGWSLMSLMFLATLYWMWHGPLQSVRECIDLCMRRRLHAEAAAAAPLADHFAALPVKGTLETPPHGMQWTMTNN